MLYNDFALGIAARQGAGYPVTAVAEGLGRVSATLTPPDATLASLIEKALHEAECGDVATVATAAGEALFRWLLADALETHLRLAWDRAEQAGRGLRLRLSIDPPDIAALPWELLHDPRRDHCFATDITTPLIRSLDQASFFGGLACQEARLPLHMLLVLPDHPDLNLAQEQALIEEALQPLREVVTLRVLKGRVTRTALSDALLESDYDIVHLGGHAAYDGKTGYLGLNAADGSADWVETHAVARIFANHRSVKLLLLNACRTARVDGAIAFRGLAPQLVRAGVPAVAGMLYPVSDAAALTFAREFYHQLCRGAHAGRVDVAITYARSMLAVLHPDGYSFAAPVLYTHAADGLIFRLPQSAALPEDVSERTRLEVFLSSLESSREWAEDWALAGRDALIGWQETLQWAERAYTLHLNDENAAARQAARRGLEMVQARLAALARALSAIPTDEGKRSSAAE